MSEFFDGETGEVIETPIAGEQNVAPYGGDMGGMQVMSRGGVIATQRIAPPRQMPTVLSSLKAQAQRAYDSWFYRLPVKGKDGKQGYIEGASIQCAMAVARAFGNCQVDCSDVQETQQAFIYSARFVDIETGFTVVRPFRQRKGAASLGKNKGRNEDMDFQIGASKAMRNVICNALADVTDYAFDAAKNSMVEKIGRNLEGSRSRAIERYAQLGIDLTRVERIYGKKSTEWLAPDIAKMVSEIQAISDGMALASDFYPDEPTPTAQPEATAKAEHKPLGEPSTKDAVNPPSEAAKLGEPLNAATATDKKGDKPELNPALKL